MLGTEYRTEYRDRTDAERREDWRQLNVKFPVTGEIVGETEWRRWRVGEFPNTQWHAKTPASILAKHAWLFDDTLEMPTGLPNG